MKKYQYQIIRYIHDHFTGEYVNVGVVVYSKDDRFLASRTTNRYQRITHMFPDANGTWILRLLRQFDSGIKSFEQQLHELFEPSDFIERITSRLITPDNNAMRLSEPKNAIDIDLNIALEDLFQNQVERYLANKEAIGTLNDEDVWRTKYKVYFDKYGIDKRLKVHEVKVPKDVISFQKSWKNEIWHCYEPLSFVLKEKDTVKDKVYKWAGRLQGLQHAGEPLHLTLLTAISPKHKELKSFINEYLKVDSGSLKVEIITEDQAESLAKRIQQKMDLHDKR
jgi:hypothetical protein